MTLTKYESSLLKELVALDTSVDKKTDYKDMVKVLRRECESIGAETHIIAPSKEGESINENIVARIDNGSDYTLALNAHYDTVPALSSEWKTPPFELVQIGDKLYGRGTNDDKGAITTILSAIREAKHYPNLELFFTCDEEAGSKYGMDYVAENYKIKSSGAVVADGEPVLFVGGSGGFVCRIIITGKGHHAGWPSKALNPLELGIPFIDRMKEFQKIIGTQVSKYSDVGDSRDSAVTGRSVLTTINGGTIGNQIPNEMVATFNVRCIPEGDVEATFNQFANFFKKERKAYLEALAASGVMNLKIELDEAVAKKRNYCANENSDIVMRMKRITGEEKLYGSHGGNDASAFVLNGVDTVSYGVFNESAHMNNEYVLERDIARVRNSFIRLLESYKE